MTTPAGWHPDPEGSGQLRWWDGRQWTSAVQPRPAAPTPPQRTEKTPSTPEHKRRNRLALGVGAAVIVALFALSAWMDDSGDDTSTTARSSQRPTTVATTAPVTTAAPTTTSAAQASASAAAAASRAESARQADAARAAEAAARTDRNTYAVLDERAFALIAKDPDAHIGEKIVAYGYVTQFDAATGTTTFRANTGSFQGGRYDYDVNTVVTGTIPLLAPIVEDDFVTIYAEVAGSLTYDTQIGGSSTVPKLTAIIVDVTG